MNEFRSDPVTGRRVIISANRDARPNQFLGLEADSSQADVGTKNDDHASCPFCDGQMDTPPIISRYGASETSNWQVCVVPNLYPVLDHPANGTRSSTNNRGLLDSWQASGFHEVVIESPTHETVFGKLAPQQVTMMLQAYRDRIQAMLDRPDMNYAQVIKNCGEQAGASLTHCHSQIFGLSFTPEQVQQEIERATKWHGAHGTCVFCDLIAAEVTADERIVAINDQFVAWCPFASRCGYETWIAPRSHQPQFESSDDGSLESLASILQLVIQRIEQHPRIDAFNYLLHTLPFDSDRHDQYHWHIEILPRIAKEAGFEWGTGIHVNTIAPERAATELRASPGS